MSVETELKRNTVNNTDILIQRLYSQLLRYNQPANGEERGKKAVFARWKIPSLVARNKENIAYTYLEILLIW